MKKPCSKNCGIEGGGIFLDLYFLIIWDPNIDDFGQKFRACGAKNMIFSLFRPHKFLAFSVNFCIFYY